MPLEGVRVLDFSRVLAGPYCTMMLGDLGADVVKIEPPEGDETRRWGPPYHGGESAYYLCCNRNKRSVVLDLSTGEGQEAARRLARRSHVVVENFKRGTTERWELDYDSLAAENPALVYCSISGFGRTGPLADLPGYDYVMQAMGGVMSITGDSGGPPVKVGIAIVDITAGMLACSAILAALRVSEAAGRGQLIDMSLFDAHLSWLANVGSSYLVTGETPARYGNGHPNIVPYQAFRASDGWLVLAVGNERQWQRFCHAVERADLAADPLFATNELRVTNRSALVPLLEALFAGHTVDAWVALLREHDVPAGPVSTVDRALESEQAKARGMVQTVEHPGGPLRLVASALGLTATPPAIRRRPPLLGEHTDEVLREVFASEGEE
jgi:formyl-CoA transferase